MGLFDKLFSGSSEPKAEDTMPWIDLNTMEQLDTIETQSQIKLQLIFKHSTRCGISRMVIGQFKKDYDVTEDQADLYYLDLIAYRDISNEIARRFNVHHESPQLVVIKNGAVIKHVSHGDINEVKINSLLN